MLDAYRTSFNISENSGPTLALLTVLIQQHLKNFTFSSINVLLKKPLPLLPHAIERRFMAGEGGYCFEHNKLFYLLLLDLGYDVTSYLGRVLLNVERDVPKTHRLNIVTVEGVSYLVDVGFGPYSPASPIKLSDEETPCATGMRYNISAFANGELSLNLLKDRGPFVLYRFERSYYNEEDYELAHFYSHQHPKANFVKNLVVSSQKDGVVYALINSTFQVITETKPTVTEVTSQAQLREILETYFNYDLEKVALEVLFTILEHSKK